MAESLSSKNHQLELKRVKFAYILRELSIRDRGKDYTSLNYELVPTCVSRGTRHEKDCFIYTNDPRVVAANLPIFLKNFAEENSSIAFYTPLDNEDSTAFEFAIASDSLRLLTKAFEASRREDKRAFEREYARYYLESAYDQQPGNPSEPKPAATTAPPLHLMPSYPLLTRGSPPAVHHDDLLSAMKPESKIAEIYKAWLESVLKFHAGTERNTKLRAELALLLPEARHIIPIAISNDSKHFLHSLDEGISAYLLSNPMAIDLQSIIRDSVKSTIDSLTKGIEQSVTALQGTIARRLGEPQPSAPRPHPQPLKPRTHDRGTGRPITNQATDQSAHGRR